MMKKVIVLLTALALTVGFTGCQREYVPEDHQLQEVKTKFVLNISKHSSSTKQSASATQADGSFLGIDKAKLLAYVLDQDGGFLPADADANKIFELSKLMSSASSSSFKSRRVLEMMMPLGTNTLLFYGRGAGGVIPSGSPYDEKDYFGYLDEYSVTDKANSAKFKLGKRLSDKTNFRTTENLLAGMLTVIMNTSLSSGASFTATAKPITHDKMPAYGFDVTLDHAIKWSDFYAATSPFDGKAPAPLEEKLSYLYKQMTSIHSDDGELRAGSTEATLRTITDLWSVINSVRWATPTSEAEAVAKYFAQTVHAHLSQFFTCTPGLEGSSMTDVAFRHLNDITSGDIVDYGIIHYIIADPFWPTVTTTDNTQDPPVSTTVSTIPEDFQVSETKLKDLASAYDSPLYDFPGEFNIPRGASYVAFDKTGKYYYYPQEFNVSAFDGQPTDASSSETVTYNAENYYYPSELLYFGNSPVRVSDREHKVGDYPDNAEDWIKDSEWAKYAPGSTTEKDWDGAAVKSSTRSVAMKYNINYGVAMLETKIGYSAAVLSSKELLDNNHYVQHVLNGIDLNSTDEPDKIIQVKDGSFKLTGLIIGGQTQNLDWSYLPTKDPDLNKTVTGFIYDKAIATQDADIPFDNGSSFSPNYTVVFDNFNRTEASKANGKQDKVYVALEFQNKTGTDFYGNFNLIRNDGYFYLIAELDPENKTVAWPQDGHHVPPYDFAYYDSNNDNKYYSIPRIFIQDFVTKATFKFDTHSLKYAYLTVPDLRASSLTMGLSVDIEWKDGMVYEELIMGGGEPQYD